MRGLWILLFWNGIGEAHTDPDVFNNTTHISLKDPWLWLAFPCQINAGKWKYVNPCVDFLGITDQRTAYLKRRRAGSAIVDGRTYVDQVSPQRIKLQSAESPSNAALYVANIVEHWYTRTEPANVERVFHSQISSTRLRSRGRRSTGRTVPIVRFALRRILKMAS